MQEENKTANIIANIPKIIFIIVYSFLILSALYQTTDKKSTAFTEAVNFPVEAVIYYLYSKVFP